MGKVTGLAPYVKEAMESYETAVKAYVHEITTSLFGQLMTFFEGVDTRFKSMDTIEHETIQYEEQFSNRILSKLINKYPESTIKRGLYQEYKRMNKSLTPEEGLLPVIWDRVKVNVTDKFKHFENLIAKCYKNQRLQFDSNRLTEIFGEVEHAYVERNVKNASETTPAGDGASFEETSLSEMDASQATEKDDHS